MNKVLVTEAIHEKGLKLLKQEVEVVQGTAVDEDTIIKEAQNCQGILIRSARITENIIKNTPMLKVIGKHGIGLDNIDLKLATERGIAVVNAPESNINSVAEHTFAMILVLAKNLIIMDRKVRQGEFKARNRINGMELKGKTIGLIGLGKISMLLVKKLKSLDINIIAYDPYVKKEFGSQLGVELSDKLEKVFTCSDFVSVHVPLLESTRGMIGEDQFKCMNKNAYFINVARGPIVDEKALYNALLTKSIKGAAVDVFEQEPPSNDNQLFELDNILLSPHNAALTEEALIAMAMHSSQGILDYLNGKKPKYIVNSKVME